MSKNKNLVNYALGCIKRYKIRTLVILICLIVSASVFSSVAFIKDGLTAQGAISVKYSPDITVQGISSGRQAPVDTGYIGYIQEAAGVTAVIPRIWGYANIGNTLLVIVGVDVQNSTFVSSYSNVDASSIYKSMYPLESGSFLNAQTNNTVVIGKAVADLLGARVGSILTILSESNQPFRFAVAGIFNSESSIYNADMILMNINDARNFFDLPQDKVTDLLVYVSSVDSSNQKTLVNYVAREISDLPNTRIVTKNVIMQAQQTTYGDRAGFFSIVWYVILISVAIIAFNQTVVVGHESKFEVGLLKSLGFSTTDIIKVRLIESAVLGTLAAAVGLTIGILYDAVLGAPIIKDFMMGWAALYPGFSVPIFISPLTLTFVLAITIVPLLFATIIPSWVNATVDPDIAMRGARA
jgi:ABC-type lipoprotein release transport system permease subunit